MIIMKKLLAWIFAQISRLFLLFDYFWFLLQNIRIVQRGDKYAIRAGWIFHSYKDLENSYWWPNSYASTYYCFGTLDEIKKAYKTYINYEMVIK